MAAGGPGNPRHSRLGSLRYAKEIPNEDRPRLFRGRLGRSQSGHQWLRQPRWRRAPQFGFVAILFLFVHAKTSFVNLRNSINP